MHREHVVAIEAHARTIARQTAANTEETARLRAVLRARPPPPPKGADEAGRGPAQGVIADPE